jgi:hypothetical protein
MFYDDALFENYSLGIFVVTGITDTSIFFEMPPGYHEEWPMDVDVEVRLVLRDGMEKS